MKKPKNPISRKRDAAADRQGGMCLYCGVLMCRGDTSEFAANFGLRPAQAFRLSCTAEHLVARQNGGGNTGSNIAAACWHCNQTRHRRKEAPDPVAYRNLVSRRVQAGKWHMKNVFEAGLLCLGTTHLIHPAL